MANTELLAFPSPVANLGQYLQLVEQFPRLEEREERVLAERLQRDHDIDAAWRLVTSHLRYVVQIARGYAGYGLNQEDLIQEGNLGLMKAVQRFDPSRGVRLISYAAYWIRAQIHDFIMRNWRIVKVATTKARRRLFYKLRSTKQRLEWLRPEEAEAIAEKLDVTAADVLDMDISLYAADASFDEPVGGSTDVGPSPERYLADTTFDPAALVDESDYLSNACDALPDALAALDARSRTIIESRWLAEDGQCRTLQQLGDRFGISAERVRQLEAAALARLRDALAPVLGTTEGVPS
ncbi:MAG: RNA polymerase sigma factor RpoH [Woeseiaceae bacterium]|nr:RNA polymerase sigma factor RpoH [Woeseiaceae bacterium]